MRKRLVGTDHHNDEAFFDLSTDARFIYFHMITHPQMTSLGLLRITPGGLADECGLTREECATALDELAAIGRLEYDRRCVALSEDYLEVPANPSVVMGWGKLVDLLPRTDLVRRRMGLAVSMVRRRATEVGDEKASAWTDSIPEAMLEMADAVQADPRPEPRSSLVTETPSVGVEDSVAHGVREGVEDNTQTASRVAWDGEPEGVQDTARHPVPHGVEDGVRHRVGDGAGHRVGDGAGHGVEDGVAHSIFHLPTSNIQIPSSQSRLAGSDARAREADDGWDREGLLHKASAVVRRQLEVEEIETVDSWVAQGIPTSLIENALADGLRRRIYRLKWVDHRLNELVKGHLHQHPELEHDDLDFERSVALSSLSDEEISGHLSKSRRKRARAAIRRAVSAEQVRMIIDATLTV